MKVHQFQVGNMENFTYILEDEESGEAIILDPSWNLDEIQKEIVRRDLKIKYIVNTHHHFDHTLGNEAMAKETHTQILQHESSTLKHDISLVDGQKIIFGNSKLTVFHTPGHSKDSICLVGDGKIFTGDTLFVGNCGRVDLPGGSARELYHSLFDILGKMDENLVLYPGHNYGSTPVSTLGKEKQNNFVLQKRSEQEFVELMGQ
jgi:glyoxylase-like metal-dependent hydrolase (beta-lactamase superfamily II)